MCMCTRLRTHTHTHFSSTQLKKRGKSFMSRVDPVIQLKLDSLAHKYTGTFIDSTQRASRSTKRGRTGMAQTRAQSARYTHTCVRDAMYTYVCERDF
jgi:hypothetical protein